MEGRKKGEMSIGEGISIFPTTPNIHIRCRQPTFWTLHPLMAKGGLKNEKEKRSKKRKRERGKRESRKEKIQGDKK